MNRFKPGDTVRIVTLKNHPTDQHRIYDFPEKIRWIGESIVPRSFIGKVSGGSVGIVVEVKSEQCKVLFFGGEVFGWISENHLEIHTV